MKKIRLTQGKFALVDDEDFEELSKIKWCAIKRKTDYTWYAAGNEKVGKGKWKTVLMHRVITNAPKGKVVDHDDGNGLNNQRSNLKACTQHDNQMNRHKLQCNNTSGIHGVSHMRGGWLARLTRHGKSHYLGYFGTKKEAKNAVEAFKLYYAG